MRTLILGGARSGKSALAEELAREDGREVVYVATAEARDGEMRTRIAHHLARRPAEWLCVEEPVALAAALQVHARDGRVLLVDCLTLWLSNVLHIGTLCFESQRAALLDALPGLPGEILLVSNEVGLGVVPMGEFSRRFVDEAGRLNQAVAASVERVLFVAAGLPVALKGELP
jgi:adenosylcobinamide kinase/adenosylcobinamide-phosphate guanylyltransferase